MQKLEAEADRIHAKMMTSILLDDSVSLKTVLQEMETLDRTAEARRGVTNQDRNNNKNNNNNNNNYKRPLVELVLHEPRPFPKLDYHHTPRLAAATVAAFRQGLILPLRGPSDDCLDKPLPELIEEAERLAKVYRGGTALHAAVCLRRLEAVRLLLRAGGEECKEVDDLDRGMKPLYFCFRKGKDKDDTVMALLLNGMNMER